MNRRVVNAGYFVSIAYVVGDVGYEGYKATLDRTERLGAKSMKQAAIGDKSQSGISRPGEPSAATEIGLRVARRTGEASRSAIYCTRLILLSKSQCSKAWRRSSCQLLPFTAR